MIDWPGLKPSLRLNSVGSTGTPLTFVGNSARVRATRRPVADVLSFLVCATFDGNGSRHARLGVPLQVAAEAAEGSSASAPSAPRSLRFIAALKHGAQTLVARLARVALYRLERGVAAALVVARML